jgi:hypothetical protein
VFLGRSFRRPERRLELEILLVPRELARVLRLEFADRTGLARAAVVAGVPRVALAVGLERACGQGSGVRRARLALRVPRGGLDGAPDRRRAAAARVPGRAQRIVRGHVQGRRRQQGSALPPRAF